MEGGEIRNSRAKAHVLPSSPFVKALYSPLGYWQKVNQSPTQAKPCNTWLSYDRVYSSVGPLVGTLKSDVRLTSELFWRSENDVVFLLFSIKRRAPRLRVFPECFFFFSFLGWLSLKLAFLWGGRYCWMSSAPPLLVDFHPILTSHVFGDGKTLVRNGPVCTYTCTPVEIRARAQATASRVIIRYRLQPTPPHWCGTRRKYKTKEIL